MWQPSIIIVGDKFSKTKNWRETSSDHTFETVLNPIFVRHKWLKLLADNISKQTPSMKLLKVFALNKIKHSIFNKKVNACTTHMMFFMLSIDFEWEKRIENDNNKIV